MITFIDTGLSKILRTGLIGCSTKEALEIRVKTAGKFGGRRRLHISKQLEGGFGRLC